MKTRRLRVCTIAIVMMVLGAMALGVDAVFRPNSDSATANGATESSPIDVGKKRVPVVVTSARSMAFENRVVVSGSVHAKRYALVSARIPGTLDALFVDEGDAVVAGSTQLFQTDSLKLNKAVDIAEQDLKVAECAVLEKRALLEKNREVLLQSQSDNNRYRELVKRNAIAKQVLERQESHSKQCEADVRHTQALIDLASAQLEQAQLNLQIAEKDQKDSLVVSPINGLVTENLREPGEMAGAGTPVLRIEDPTLLEASVFLPEELYAQVIVGKTEMHVQVANTQLGKRLVSFKGPTVNHKLRTFKVEGLVEAPPPDVTPGCLAEVTIVTDRRDGVGVPTGAVQTRAGTSVVFVVTDDKARMMAVKTGRQSEGWIEILDGLSSDAPVISMGQTLVEEGTSVSIVEEGTP